MGKRVKLVLLWHMHQPPYRDPVLQEYSMPWTLLHAMRDYLDMPMTCVEQGAKATFNLVPSLLFQVEDYANEKIRDRFLKVTLKPASSLSVSERMFLVDNFFELHQETMVNPYPRFKELARRARVAPGGPETRWRVFSDDEFRDLQIWYYLSWTGEKLRQRPMIKALFEKGRDFTEEDKKGLKDEVVVFLKEVEAYYREAVNQGTLEVSFSPLYHPILPLLVGTEAATAAKPDATLPLERFKYPQDASAQISLAKVEMERRLDTVLGGVWPPEGSVSPDVVRMLGQEGVKWIATDSEILRKSLGHMYSDQSVYRPWRFSGVNIFFRDHRLSDLIGFVYSKWKPEDAAAHFRDQLLEIAASFPESEVPVVTVALDGENAWEHYDCGGYNFLRILYQTLASCEMVEMVTPSQVISAGGPSPELQHLAHGSWIDACFSTWIGDPVKNHAWEILAAARRTLEQWLREHTIPADKRAELMDIVYRAEASDWFWWFGEGHTSRFDLEFDTLFRHHIKALYSAMDMEPPRDLDKPLYAARKEESSVQMPTHFISPMITGRRERYYKWMGAGKVVLEQGSIHKANPIIEELAFGYNEDKMFLKLEGSSPMREMLLAGATIELHIHEPLQKHLKIVMEGDSLKAWSDGREACVNEIEIAAQTVLEVAIPLGCIYPESERPVDSGVLVEMYFRVTQEGRELERFPFNNNLCFNLRGEELALENWSA